MAELASPPLILQKQHLQIIIHQAKADFPHETCGVILGIENTSAEVIPVTNTAPSPTTAFTMSPQELVKIFIKVEREPVNLLAFYHSHPHSKPIPSSTDLAQAYYPNTPMLILGQQDGEWTPKAYYLQETTYTPTSIQIV